MYNQIEKLRIDDLKTEHVRIILLAIPTRRMAQWYACREGDMQWQPISDIPEFYEDVRALKGLSPAGEAKSDPRLAAEVKAADMLDTRTMKPRKNKPVSSRAAMSSEATAPPKAPKQPPVKSAQMERRPLFEDAPPEFATDPAFNVVTSRAKERRSARRYPRVLDFQVKLGDKIFQCQTRDISIGGISLSDTLPKWVPKTFRAKVSHKGSVVRLLCDRVTDSKLRVVQAESWELIRKWIVNW